MTTKCCEGCPENQGDKLEAIAASTSCPTCGRYAWTADMCPKRDVLGAWHHPACAALWSASVGGWFDFISDPWEKFINGGPLGDFLNTPAGKIFGGVVKGLAAIAEPGLLGSILSATPVVGTTIAMIVANPLVEQALPGLVRGERVDHAFVDSAKTIIQRIIANGGTPDAATAQLGTAVQDATAELQAAFPGVTPAALALYNDGLRIKAGLRTAEDNLPPDAQNELDQHLAPYAAALDPARLAAKYGVPQDVMQGAIDGVLRIANYDPAHFDAQGNALPTGAALAHAAAAFSTNLTTIQQGIAMAASDLNGTDRMQLSVYGATHTVAETNAEHARLLAAEHAQDAMAAHVCQLAKQGMPPAQIAAQSQIQQNAFGMPLPNPLGLSPLSETQVRAIISVCDAHDRTIAAAAAQSRANSIARANQLLDAGMPAAAIAAQSSAPSPIPGMPNGAGFAVPLSLADVNAIVAQRTAASATALQLLRSGISSEDIARESAIPALFPGMPNASGFLVPLSLSAVQALGATLPPTDDWRSWTAAQFVAMYLSEASAG